MGRKAMPKAVACRWLAEANLPNRGLDRPLENRLVQVMPASLTGTLVSIEARRRKPIAKPTPGRHSHISPSARPAARHSQLRPRGLRDAAAPRPRGAPATRVATVLA